MDGLKLLLGDAYKDGMTVDEINTALQGKKFADLSTGAYVDKNKYEADIRAKDETIKQKAAELANKMTADEKAQADAAAKDALIESLQKKIREDSISNSKSSANAILAANKTLLGIADNDDTFDKFVSSIASEDHESTKVLATYINKLMTDSYEKGKKDAVKDKMGNFSKGVTTSSSASKDKDLGALGTELAKSALNDNVDSNLYFK